MIRRIAPSAVLLLSLAACSDLFMDAERIPTSLELQDTVVTAMQGQRLQLAVTVLDQNGRAFDRLPAWATPEWTTTNAALVDVAGDELIAVSAGQAHATVSVAGLTASTRVRVNPTQLRLTVSQVQLTQAAQPDGGTAPLVAGRDATLRVFLRGDRTNFFSPQVRVTVYTGPATSETVTATAADGLVPTEIDPLAAGSSWNLLIPARLVVPGMRLLVQADPSGAVPLAAGSSTVFPANGVPLAADVRAVPPLFVRMVPVRTANGITGAVSPATTEAYLAPLRAMFPVQQVSASVHATYVSSYNASTQTGWSNILREMALLRVAESSTHYYYGVVNSTSGGIAGIGYIGYPAALGYDLLPDGAQTMAHELGHNFGRQHAPCGNPAGPDPTFPTAGALLDVTGWDVGAGAARGQLAYRDLMSYCAPEWITWYTYRAIMDYRNAWDWPSAAQSRAPEPVLLVWGTVRDGEVTLEPAVELVARARMPETAGPYRIEAADASGATLYGVSFAAAEVADVEGGDRHFAFAIPRRMLPMDRVASIRLVANGRRATVSRAAAPAAGIAPVAPRFSLAAPAGGGRGVSVAWDAARAPLVVVRDARTGDILSLARGGRADVRTDAPEVELLFSDGVRTSTQRVRVRNP
jgi:hypothetical protein